MKTKSMGKMVLLNDGVYRGYWFGVVVSVPFEGETALFDVLEFRTEEIEVFVTIRDHVAYVETLGD